MSVTGESHGCTCEQYYFIVLHQSKHHSINLRVDVVLIAPFCCNTQTFLKEIKMTETDTNPNCLDIVNEQVSNLSLPKKKSGIAGACSNLINSIVGAGIIGIPFALDQSGLVAGVCLLILVSYFTGTFRGSFWIPVWWFVC